MLAFVFREVFELLNFFELIDFGGSICLSIECRGLLCKRKKYSIKNYLSVKKKVVNKKLFTFDVVSLDVISPKPTTILTKKITNTFVLHYKVRSFTFIYFIVSLLGCLFFKLPKYFTNTQKLITRLTHWPSNITPSATAYKKLNLVKQAIYLRRKFFNRRFNKNFL